MIVGAVGGLEKALPPKKRRLRRKRGLRVLLAEDNLVNQKLQRRLLEKLGHEVTVVGNGKEAVSAAASVLFDLIVMDVQMPEMDGLEAASLIRSQQKASQRRIPIMALTAHAAAEDRERCRAAGMDVYLSKPVRMADLENAINGLFPDLAEGRQALRGKEPGSVPDGLIDEQKVLEGLGGDHELFEDVLRLFLQDSARLLREIQSAAVREDPAALGRFAHALKGSIANLSAGPAHMLAAELEKMGRNGFSDATPQLVRDLEEALRKLQASASHFLQREHQRQMKTPALG
jgi:CheY-like chemotaxis protein